MGWRVIGEGRSFGDNEDMEREVERAYKEGCRDGYEKAMSEMRGGGMGFRENGRYDSDGMNERRMPGYFPESVDFAAILPFMRSASVTLSR